MIGGEGEYAVGVLELEEGRLEGGLAARRAGCGLVEARGWRRGYLRGNGEMGCLFYLFYLFRERT